MATAKQEEMAERRKLVLKALKRLKKARYKEILEWIGNAESSDKEIDYPKVRQVFDYWRKHGLENDKGSVEDKGNGVWEYQKPTRKKNPVSRLMDTVGSEML